MKLYDLSCMYFYRRMMEAASTPRPVSDTATQTRFLRKEQIDTRVMEGVALFAPRLLPDYFAPTSDFGPGLGSSPAWAQGHELFFLFVLGVGRVQLGFGHGFGEGERKS